MKRIILSLVIYAILFVFSPHCLTYGAINASTTPHITITKDVPTNLHIILPNLLKDKILDSEVIHAFRIYYRQNHVLIRGWVI